MTPSRFLWPSKVKHAKEKEKKFTLPSLPLSPLAGLGFLLFPISSVHLPSNKEALQPQNDFLSFRFFVVGEDNIYVPKEDTNLFFVTSL